MSRPDLDNELRQALRRQETDVSADFNRRILEQMDARSQPTGWLRRPALVAATVAVAMLAAFGVAEWRQSAETTQAMERQQLLDEVQALEMELRQVRQLTEERRPVLYLGGDETFDVVYDVAAFQSAGNNTIRPASMPDRG